MKEIISIFLIVIFFSTIFLVPYNKIVNSKLSNLNDDFFQNNVENLIIFSNLILILSFFAIKLTTIINILIIFSLLIIFFYRKNLIIVNTYKYSLLFFFFVVFILSIDLAYNLTLYWDAQSMWLPKAILFYNDDNISNLESFLRPEYPYLGSLLWAFFWKISFLEYEYLGRIIYIVIFCLSLFSFINLLKVSSLQKYSIIIVYLLLIYQYWHFRGTQEILIFSFLLISSKYIYLIIFEKKNDYQNLIFLFLTLNLIIWTKSEGLFFSIFICLILLLFSNYNFKIKFLSIVLFLFLIFTRFGVYEIFEITVALSPDYKFERIFDLLILNFNLSNILFISKHILFSIIKFPYILLSFVMGYIVLKNHNLIKELNFLLIYILLNILFIVLIYLTSITDLRFMVVTGLNRIMFESFAPVLIFSIIYLNKIFKS